LDKIGYIGELEDNMDKSSLKWLLEKIRFFFGAIMKLRIPLDGLTRVADKRRGYILGKINSGFSIFKRYEMINYFVILIVVIAGFSYILFPPGWHNIKNENVRNILKVHFFKEGIEGGSLYPRWVPELYGGYGYPLFVFYQPGFYYLAFPFTYLPNYPIMAMQITVLFLFLIGATGAYNLCKEITNKWGATLCSILFIYTPYVFVNLFVRTDYTEFTAMMFTPWPLFFLLKLRKSIKLERNPIYPIFGLAVSIALVVYSHPITALFYVLALSTVAVYLIITTKSYVKVFLVLFLVSMILGLSLSSPYWYHALALKDQVNLNAAIGGYYRAERHVLFAEQLFSNFWGYGRSAGLNGRDTAPYQLGLPHFILALLGTLIARRNKMIQISFLVYGILILAMLDISYELWKNIHILKFIQFPWRLLSVIAIFQTILIAGFTKRIQGTTFTKSFILISIVLVLVLWNPSQFQPKNKVEGYTGIDNFLGFGKQNLLTGNVKEFLPLTVKRRLPKGEDKRKNPDPMIIIRGKGSLEQFNDSTNNFIHYKIELTKKSKIIIHQIYFTGWKVIVDGEEVPIEDLEKDLNTAGVITVKRDKGMHELKA
jgi:hypothetical protein